MIKFKEITETAATIAQHAERLHKQIRRVQFIELEAVDKMQNAIEELQHTVVEICEEFDEEDASGFRKPAPLYDTREEKKQALEGP